MRLFVNHRTVYLFTQPQARIVQLLRTTPAGNGGQSVIAWHVEVDRDARFRHARDGYGNETATLYVDGPVDGLAIAIAGEVLTEDRAGVVAGTAEPLPPLHFLQPTPLTAATAEVAAFARDAIADARDLAAAHALSEAVHARLAPVPAAVGTDQRAAARLAEGRADPQGAGHVLIAAARAARVPARYVAGYLYRPEEPDGTAAHGWAELWVEGYGWIGFDPSEGRCPTERYVRVAIGLDHLGAAPISGARIGAGDELLTVAVHVGPEPGRA